MKLNGEGDLLLAEKIAKFCSNCGIQVNADDTFCNNCGASLIETIELDSTIHLQQQDRQTQI